MAVDFKQANPNFLMELLTKGEPSPFMNEIFADPNIPIFNARNPVVGNAEMNWNNKYGNKLRSNWTNEFEKNLRSYGNYGFYAKGVPTMGTSSFQRKTSLPENLLRNTDNTNRRVITTPDTKFIDKLRFSLEQKPGYDFMDIKTPTADYVVNAGRMFPDPIGNLGHHRGRAEMANQHNFLLVLSVLRKRFSGKDVFL